MKHRTTLMCKGYFSHGIDNITHRPAIVLTYIDGDSSNFLRTLVGSDRIVDLIARKVVVEIDVEDDVESPFDKLEKGKDD